jgi:lipopolysaccharide/colanic/teichoic acid biosynthesis glycosyltransferase
MVRPGLTGWAQVRYQYANNLEEEIEKLRYDLYYVKHVSVWLDLRILADTCRVLFSGGLSDGVEAAHRSSETVRARPFRAPRKLNPTRAA